MAFRSVIAANGKMGQAESSSHDPAVDMPGLGGMPAVHDVDLY